MKKVILFAVAALAGIPAFAEKAVTAHPFVSLKTVEGLIHDVTSDARVAMTQKLLSDAGWKEGRVGSVSFSWLNDEQGTFRIEMSYGADGPISEVGWFTLDITGKADFAAWQRGETLESAQSIETVLLTPNRAHAVHPPVRPHRR